MDDELIQLTPDHFTILTEADIAMLEYATSVRSDDLDYSAFYVDDDEDDE